MKLSRCRRNQTAQLHDLCKVTSAYEIAEDLQTIAETLGQKDKGWKDLASVLRHANAHVSTVGSFPDGGA